MHPLKGKVALVTGASRGVGKGIALGLGEAGMTVYVTGRSVEEGTAHLPGTVIQTAQEVTALGGAGVAVRCDHRDDEEVEAVFKRVVEERGRLDVLVNNVWGGYEFYYDGTEFWKERGFWDAPVSRWDAMFQAGARAHYVASVLAAKVMVTQRHGLIVNISFWAAQKYLGGPAYGAAKAATDKMAKDMAVELRSHNVAAVSLYPGLVRTEGVIRAAEHFDLSNSESPRFVGRAVAALAADPDVMKKSGQVLVTAALAQEYGFTDLNGKSPRPLRLEEA